MLRAPTTFLIIAALLVPAVPVAAATFAVRDVQGIFNGRVSYGGLYRLNDRDKDLIAIASGGI